MQFNTVEYWLFFAAVLLLFYPLPFRYGRVLLLAASYAFYANWSSVFLLLIIASTVVDYTLGLLLGSERVGRKRLLLIISLVVNLGLLGFFKYYNFFASSAAEVVGKPAHAFVLNIILPVGISFYTFASLSYTIDVYWGRMKPVRNIIDYALFVSFFPHLPAGPIVRARQFISQIWTWQKPSAVVVQSGIVLILSGLVKKMIFADRFAITVNNYFSDIGAHPGSLPAASVTGAFFLQLFFDFSGYTDIARGCAKLLGFEFPLNFVRPYLAANVVQFWQRWHISLGRWVHDYVFRPLTSHRHGRFVIARNLMITMLLVGFWHGASWQFIIWGGYYGFLLVTYRFYRHATAGTIVRRITGQRAFIPVAVALTTAFNIFPLLLFRTPTLHDTAMVLRSLCSFKPPYGHWLLTAEPCTLFLIAFTIAIFEERTHWIERMATAPAFVRICGYVLVFLALELFSVTEQQVPFVYFQF